MPVYTYPSLDAFQSRTNTPNGLYSILIDGLFFDLIVKNRGLPTTTVVFHAAEPNRSQKKLPLFYGQTIAGDKANVILVSDPSLHCSATIPLGWYAGTRNNNIQKNLTDIFRSLLPALGSEKIIFSGPSGGGFAALYFSHQFPESLAIAHNPQIEIAKFKWSAVRKYAETCFNSDTDEDVLQDLQKLSCADLTSLYKRPVPNYSLICQNAHDWQIESHIDPFLRNIAPLDADRIRLVYGAWGLGGGDGHQAPNSNQQGRLLVDAAAWPSDWRSFIENYDASWLGYGNRSQALESSDSPT